jgi:hypothetical protein
MYAAYTSVRGEAIAYTAMGSYFSHSDQQSVLDSKINGRRRSEVKGGWEVEEEKERGWL